MYRRSPPLNAPSPKLTGANNVPVPPRKAWKVDGSSGLQSNAQETQRDTNLDERMVDVSPHIANSIVLFHILINHSLVVRE